MAQKKNRKRTAPAVSRSAPAPSLPLDAQPLSPESGKGRIRRAGARLLESAIDTALEAVWLGLGITLGGMALTALVTAILYLRAPESAWIYSLFKYALVYAGGMLTLFLIIFGFALLGVRRRRLRERESSARFKSAEKGYLDHWLHQGESIQRFALILGDIGSQMGRMGKSSAQIGGKLATANDDPRRAHRIITKGAAILDNHAAKMERSIETLKDVTALLLESTMALAQLASPASEGNAEKLQTAREACVGLIEKSEVALVAVQDFRGNAVAALGISQDTNSAMNRIIYGLESIITILQEALTSWRKTVAVLDRKLAA